MNFKRDKYTKSARPNNALKVIDMEGAIFDVNLSYLPKTDAIDFANEARKVGLDEHSIILLEMRYYDCMSSREIARELKLSHSTVNERIRAAIDYLRNNLLKDKLIPEKRKKLTYFRPEPIEWAFISKQ
jgi:DNA-binding CsgD family transcriptional regulator